MTRAETITAIKAGVDPTHTVNCAQVPAGCPECAVLWLLQEIEYRDQVLTVHQDMLDLLKGFEA